MRHILKQIFQYLPLFLQRIVLSFYESYWTLRTLLRLSENEKNFIGNKHAYRHKKPQILFYHISGLHFGGTEKFLQIIAKYINKNKYDVFFLYSSKARTSGVKSDGRKAYLENVAVDLIDFDYESAEARYPYFIKNTNPSIFEVIQKREIDLVITAGSGYSEFPFNVIKNIPIILINIFGSPNAQGNIVKNICISHEVAQKVIPILPREKVEVMYIQSEKPIKEKEESLLLRKRFNIPEDAFVFGRIGRADDGIFDPIGIRAFQKVVRENPSVHYLIMSPPPILLKLVEKERIPNVHFIPSSSQEKDVWTFHYAIDCLAHFRNDGESFGLNIAESMLAGNPIITHKSHIWNAQLEYLENSFSRVADKDDVESYASHMKEMIEAKKNGTLKAMSEKAREKGESLFLMGKNIETFEAWVDESLKKNA